MAIKDTFTDQQKWAVILGASSGFGLATAAVAAEMGLNLFLVHRDRRQALSEIEARFASFRESGIQVVHFNKDAVADDSRHILVEELKKMLGKTDKVQLLLHSIAKGNLKSMTDDDQPLSTADLQLTANTMAFSWYAWTKALLDHQLFTDKARILGLTSSGNKKPWRTYAAVAAAKGALEALMKNMALEFAPHLRVNLLQPGITDSPALRWIPNGNELLKEAELRNPLQRATQPADVARFIGLLCQPEADWLNGCILPIDGGESLWL